MASKKKLLQAAAGSAGGAGLDVDEVFSTYLYTGDSTSPRTITNGIDLSGEGGLVWFKSRTTTTFHGLFDTERGATKRLRSDSTNAEDTLASDLTAFNSDGFTLGNGGTTNTSPREYASWTWRKAPKFFDVVTYTGDGNDNRTVSHNLGSSPGVVIVKKTDAADSWIVWHRSVPTGYLSLNVTSGLQNFTSRIKSANDTTFTLGTSGQTNSNGASYVAYVFAHNNSDGEFGPDSDQDIIKCGSYTGNGSTSGPEINLGFEPQFVIVKRTDSSASWFIMDTMRGMFVGNGATGNTNYVNSNNSNAEDVFSNGSIDPTPTGFNADGTNTNINASSGNYIYMAIRRGPLAEPTSVTDVFDVDAITTPPTTGNTYTSSFDAPDLLVSRRRDGVQNWQFTPRLTSRILMTPSTAAEQTTQYNSFDLQDGVDWIANWSNDAGNYIQYFWKRAPSYFDVVAYTGNGTAGRTVNHNLGVAPEMMWVKSRETAAGWMIYHKDVGATKYLQFTTSAPTTGSSTWNDTSPTSSDFTLGTFSFVNGSGNDYVAYLFATLAGISKVGSYTGNGSTQTIDCGFSSGARFVLIKRADVGNSWFVFDSVRGIVAGNDPYLQLNATSAEDELGGLDAIDPHSSGFIVNSNLSGINNNNGTFIFYAIA